MSNQTEIGTDAPQMNAPVMSNADILAQLALTPAPVEREPSKDDKLLRCGNVYRSKFTADADKTLVLNIEGFPDAFVTKAGVVWMDIVSLQKDEEGKLTNEYRGAPFAFDTLHPSASGQSIVFRALGHTYTMNKEFYTAMVSGKERNCMIKRSPIGQ